MNYNKLNKKELEKLLKRKGLPGADGETSKEMVERLVAHDKKAEKEGAPKLDNEKNEGSSPGVSPLKDPKLSKEKLKELLGEYDVDDKEQKDAQAEAKKQKGVGSLSVAEVLLLIDGKGVKCDVPNIGGKAETMMRSLARQEKVTTMIPLEGSEKRGLAFESVTLNGFRVNLLKGFFVKVPEQVAEIIHDGVHATQEAIEDAIVVNPFTGVKSFARMDKKDERAQDALA